MHPRMSLAEMGMLSVPSLLPIPPMSEELAEDGNGSERIIRSRERFPVESPWSAEALSRANASGRSTEGLWERVRKR